MASPEQQMANLNAILRWSIEHGHKEDAPAESTAKPMSKERREWLIQALSGVSDMPDVLDVVAKRLKGLNAEGSGALELSEDELAEAQEATLEEMLVVVDNIDFARDFGRIGGAEALLSLLESERAGLRWRSSEVVATIVQNNPACQDMMLKLGVIPTLVQLVEKDSDHVVRTKALLALASQIRGHVQSLEEFLKVGGLATMRQALERNRGSAKSSEARKILFLLPGIMDLRPTFAETLRETGLLELVTSFCFVERKKEAETDALSSAYEYNPLRESAIRASIAILTGVSTSGLAGRDSASSEGGGESKAEGKSFDGGQDLKRKVVGRVVALSRLEKEDDVMAAADELVLLKQLVKTLSGK